MDLTPYKYIVHFWKETPFNTAISKYIETLLVRKIQSQEAVENLVNIPVLAKKITEDSSENYFQDPNKILGFIKEMSEMFWKDNILFIYMFWLQNSSKKWIDRPELQSYTVVCFDEFIKSNT